MSRLLRRRIPIGPTLPFARRARMMTFSWLSPSLAVAAIALYFCGCGTAPTRRPTPEVTRTTLKPAANTIVSTPATITTTTPMSTRETANCIFGDMACRMASLDLDDRCLFWKTGECEKLPGQPCSCIPPTRTASIPTEPIDSSAAPTTTTTTTITTTTKTTRTIRFPVFPSSGT